MYEKMIEKKYNQKIETIIRDSWKVLDRKQKINLNFFSKLEGKLLLYFNDDRIVYIGGSSVGLYQEPDLAVEGRPLAYVLGTKSDLRKYLTLLHLVSLEEMYYIEKPEKFFSDRKNKFLKNSSRYYYISTWDFPSIFEWQNLSFNPAENKYRIRLCNFKLGSNFCLAGCVPTDVSYIDLDRFQDAFKDILIKESLEAVQFDANKVKTYARKIEKSERSLIKTEKLRIVMADLLDTSRFYENEEEDTEIGTTSFFKNGKKTNEPWWDQTRERGKYYGRMSDYDNKFYNFYGEVRELIKQSNSHRDFCKKIIKIIEETDKPVLDVILEKTKLNNDLLEQNHNYLNEKIFPKIPKEILIINKN